MRARYLNGDRWADLGPDQRDLGPVLAFGLLVMCFLCPLIHLVAAGHVARCIKAEKENR